MAENKDQPAPMNLLEKFVASGLGTGYLPVAPGTWGSAAAAGAFLLAAWRSGGGAVCTFTTMLLVLLAASAACVMLGPAMERTWGRKDPSQSTLDEWAGQALTLLGLPMGGAGGWGCPAGLVGPQAWLIVAAAGFVAFRFFDIVKPFPARRAEKLPHGWGILTDDLIAGVYANLLCQLVLRVILPAIA